MAVPVAAMIAQRRAAGSELGTKKIVETGASATAAASLDRRSCISPSDSTYRLLLAPLAYFPSGALGAS